MKTILLGIVLAAFCVHGAMAADNGCKDQSSGAGCNEIFSNIQVGGVDIAMQLVNQYMTKQGTPCDSVENISDGFGRGGANIVGNDYFNCIQGDQITTFVFDDASENASGTASIGHFNAECLMYGGGMLAADTTLPNRCDGISKDDCNQIIINAGIRTFFEGSDESGTCYMSI